MYPAFSNASAISASPLVGQGRGLELAKLLEFGVDRFGSGFDDLLRFLLVILESERILDLVLLHHRDLAPSRVSRGSLMA